MPEYSGFILADYLAGAHLVNSSQRSPALKSVHHDDLFTRMSQYCESPDYPAYFYRLVLVRYWCKAGPKGRLPGAFPYRGELSPKNRRLPPKQGNKLVGQTTYFQRLKNMPIMASFVFSAGTGQLKCSPLHLRFGTVCIGNRSFAADFIHAQGFAWFAVENAIVEVVPLLAEVVDGCAIEKLGLYQNLMRKIKSG